MPISFYKLMAFLVLAISISLPATAVEKSAAAVKTPSSQCGVFEVTGYLKKVGNNYMILLAPGSRSETQIVLASQALGDAKHPVLLPAQESFITAKVQMNSPINHYRGSIQKISDVQLAVPNEMRGDKGTGLRLLEAKPCIIQSM